MDLALIMAVILGLAIGAYVLLDGFSLGVGILFPFGWDTAQRDQMMTSVAPVWDGNQTWLVLGGTLLFAGFPKIYSLLLPIFYVPLMVMLVALVFRGVAFEFRFKANNKKRWDIAFTAGSITAAFCQGLILGTFVQGFEFVGSSIAGTLLWWTPFSIMTGFAVVCGYALLGACWLILKTEGPLQHWLRSAARRLLLGVMFFIALVSLWTPVVEPEIALRWFSWPNVILLAPIPMFMAGLAFALYVSLRRSETAPFVLCGCLFMTAYLGLVVSIWPYLVPRHITIWAAAAPHDSLIFALVGIVLILPVIIGYTAHAYYVFRGKVRTEDAYH